MLTTMQLFPLPAPPLDGIFAVSHGVTGNSKPHGKGPIPTVATHTRSIGMIHPPLDMRSIVDKTAHFVATHGPDFEKRVMVNNEGKPKFSFLKWSDPYHAYYQHRLTELRFEVVHPSPSHPEESVVSAAASCTTDGNETVADVDATLAGPSARFGLVRRALEPPECEQYTVRHPEGITGEELDIIKLTAQFVARNGKSFLTGLAIREINKPHFQFLKPTNSKYLPFTKYSDVYSKVLMPPMGLIDKLRSVADLATVLEHCLHRLDWERCQEQDKQKAEVEIQQERVQMALIDWHDFYVVETIEFTDDEDAELPPSMTLAEVMSWSNISAMEDQPEVVERGNEAGMEIDEEEVHLVEEGMKAACLEETVWNMSERKAAAPGQPEPPMRIVKSWKRPEDRISAQRNPTKFVASPITGELIPINEMAEHMRISLIDPKFKEQKDRKMAEIRETTLAHDDEMVSNIVGLARTRPDIFGTTEEEVSNAVKEVIEKKKDEHPTQVIWDGPTGSTRITANQAMFRNVSEEEHTDAANSKTRTIPWVSAPPRPDLASVHPLPPPLPPLAFMNLPDRPLPTSPGSHFTRLGGSRSFTPLLIPPHVYVIPPPPLPQGMPPPPPKEAPPPLPDEPESKRQRIDFSLMSEEQFLAQNQGRIRITINVPNIDEGNLKGQHLEIVVDDLSETVSSLKEKIAGEVQLPANKQKLSGRAGFLKDNMSLAYYNIGDEETLTLALRERGGRKR
ncbi:hypothetical protein IFM89_020690 [Coptis chinensis]|uniref:Splicing factor 3A subunit 1 n=1 Tax=Coptis chinensis TaxID=261450 RepID=A0A835M496_9MAGN|nr:hypothetical protein IFM89_020690 [Coptis chinensis]